MQVEGSATRHATTCVSFGPASRSLFATPEGSICNSTMSPERSAVGQQSGGRTEAANDILFLVGLRIDHIAAGLGRNGTLAEKQFQIALLHAVDLGQSGFEAIAEDVLARFAV